MLHKTITQCELYHKQQLKQMLGSDYAGRCMNFDECLYLWLCVFLFYIQY